MAVFKFRVIYADHEDVQRDIEIKSNQSFTDFHTAIQQSIGFDASKLGVFFVSDDFWRKAQEIKLTAENEKKKTSKKKPEPVFQQTIATLVNDPHQRFVYLYESYKEWMFQIELIKISSDEPKVQYPRCTRTIGISPKQYKIINLPVSEEEDEIALEEPLLIAEDKMDEDEIEGAMASLEGNELISGEENDIDPENISNEETPSED